VNGRAGTGRAGPAGTAGDPTVAAGPVAVAAVGAVGSAGAVLAAVVVVVAAGRTVAGSGSGSVSYLLSRRLCRRLLLCGVTRLLARAAGLFGLLPRDLLVRRALLGQSILPWLLLLWLARLVLALLGRPALRLSLCWLGLAPVLWLLVLLGLALLGLSIVPSLRLPLELRGLRLGLSELLAGLIHPRVGLLELTLTLLLLELSRLLHPFDPLFGHLFGFRCCSFEELDVAVEPLFGQAETLALGPIAHVDPVAEHLCHSFLDIEKLVKRKLCRLSHCFHALGNWPLGRLCSVGLGLGSLTHRGIGVERCRCLCSFGSTDGSYFMHFRTPPQEAKLYKKIQSFSSVRPSCSSDRFLLPLSWVGAAPRIVASTPYGPRSQEGKSHQFKPLYVPER